MREDAQKEDYVISHRIIQHPSLKANLYGLYSRKAQEWAKSQGRELAEGPAELFYSDFSMDFLEAWPLVQEV